MTYTCMPESDGMAFFEKHVNDTCKPPSGVGEPLKYVLPVSPAWAGLSTRKRRGQYIVNVLFFGAEWRNSDKTSKLLWKYHGTEVIQMV